MAPQAVILDTDIGTDVDDCLALTLILASPELKLLAVTTVYGDVLLRARMALKLLALKQVAGIPVAAGASQPLVGRPPVYWGGYEGDGLLEAADQALRPVAETAACLIVRTVMARPGEVTLIAIGPLTNLALALRLEPRLAQAVARIVVMGGVVGGAYRQHAGTMDHRYNALALPWTEHNFGSDPEAAHIVLAAGAPLTIVPLDVTSQVRIRPADVARVRAMGDPFHQAVADQVDRYPWYASAGSTNLHDPLAVAALLASGLMGWEELHAVIETGGMYTAGKLLAALPTVERPVTATIALEVEATAAETFIVNRLAA